MVKIFEESGGHIYFRRPNGYVALDTSRPMPAFVGEVSFSGVEVDFPQTPGEEVRGEYVGSTGRFRYWTVTPAYTGASTIDLGAFTGSTAPTIMYGRVKIRCTRFGGNSTGTIEAPLATDEWYEWPGGSLLLAHFGQASKIWMWRHIDIEVSGGRWKLNYRQGNDRYTTDKTYSPLWASTLSRFNIDLQLGWGVFR